MTHALKTEPQYFSAVKEGNKTFELRKADRPFKVDDILILQEYDNNQYTGEELTLQISYILKDCNKFGLKDGYVILGIK